MLSLTLALVIIDLAVELSAQRLGLLDLHITEQAALTEPIVCRIFFGASMCLSCVDKAFVRTVSRLRLGPSNDCSGSTWKYNANIVLGAKSSQIVIWLTCEVGSCRSCAAPLFTRRSRPGAERGRRRCAGLFAADPLRCQRVRLRALGISSRPSQKWRNLACLPQSSSKLCHFSWQL